MKRFFKKSILTTLLSASLFCVSAVPSFAAESPQSDLTDSNVIEISVDESDITPRAGGVNSFGNISFSGTHNSSMFMARKGYIARITVKSSSSTSGNYSIGLCRKDGSYASAPDTIPRNGTVTYDYLILETGTYYFTFISNGPSQTVNYDSTIFQP